MSNLYFTICKYFVTFVEDQGSVPNNHMKDHNSKRTQTYRNRINKSHKN